MSQRRLLHVDSDAGFCARVRLVAEDCGFAVCTVADSLEFHTAYERFRPDVIVLEIVLPGIDGLELLAWLSRQHCTAPILVFSGQSDLYRRAAELLSQWPRGLSVRGFAKPIAERDLRTIFDDSVARVLDPETPRSKALPNSGSRSKVTGIEAIDRHGVHSCAPGSA